jgi:hypothetical protein
MRQKEVLIGLRYQSSLLDIVAGYATELNEHDTVLWSACAAEDEDLVRWIIRVAVIGRDYYLTCFESSLLGGRLQIAELLYKRFGITSQERVVIPHRIIYGLVVYRQCLRHSCNSCKSLIWFISRLLLSEREVLGKNYYDLMLMCTHNHLTLTRWIFKRFKIQRREAEGYIEGILLRYWRRRTHMLHWLLKKFKFDPRQHESYEAEVHSKCPCAHCFTITTRALMPP